MSIPGPIPYGLGGASGTFTPSGIAYSYAIDTLPFLSAASRENPYTRTTAQFRKQQVDQSAEPGEQSLSGWWLRSQQSFHGGAGQLFNDSNSGDPNYSPVRFYDSSGVDPWTTGSLTLLRSTTRSTSKALTHLTVAGNGVPFAVNTTDNNVMFFVNPAAPVTDTNPSAKTLQCTASSATKYYVSAQDGIWERTHAAAMGTAWTKIWNIAPDQSSIIAFVKQRLVLADADGIYELASGGPGLPAAKWTAPSGGWTPVGITESASSIYVAGRTDRGFILQFELDASGVMPTLSSGRTVLELPYGEQINTIFGYLGTFLAIGTTLGARIARIQSDGSLEVGPLLWEFPTDQWTAFGSFLYAGVDDTDPEQFLYRVDLGTEITNLRFAYAKDLMGDTNTSPPSGVGFFPATGRLVVVSADGAWYENATYVSSGWLQTSKIRLGTLEPKLYKFLRLRGPLLEGALVASLIDDDGNSHNIAGWAAGVAPGEEDSDIPSIGPQDNVALVFTLSSGNAGTTSAEVSGYQLKAIPATPRQRSIVIPLWCFDFEQDRYGVMFGGDGTAAGRLDDLEAVDEAADVVVLQDLDRNTSVRVVIEEVRFTQTAPPDGFDGYGGIINLTVRTV